MTDLYHRKIFSFDCDIYGHLNNAAYLNIYEEARSILLDKVGHSLQDTHKQGIFLYLTNIDITFKKEVKLGATVEVKTKALETSRVRFHWYQEIFDEAGNLCNTASIKGAFVKAGKPWRIPPTMLEDLKKLEA
ncbi:MAG: acyl-CoA thioesterase [FCB group bacterium]|nr:acyl-CoA thioesterase [FCB group bacterium]